MQFLCFLKHFLHFLFCKQEKISFQQFVMLIIMNPREESERLEVDAWFLLQANSRLHLTNWSDLWQIYHVENEDWELASSLKIRNNQSLQMILRFWFSIDYKLLLSYWYIWLLQLETEQRGNWIKLCFLISQWSFTCWTWDDLAQKKLNFNKFFNSMRDERNYHHAKTSLEESLIDAFTRTILKCENDKV